MSKKRLEKFLAGEDIDSDIVRQDPSFSMFTIRICTCSTAEDWSLLTVSYMCRSSVKLCLGLCSFFRHCCECMWWFLCLGKRCKASADKVCLCWSSKSYTFTSLFFNQVMLLVNLINCEMFTRCFSSIASIFPVCLFAPDVFTALSTVIMCVQCEFGHWAWSVGCRSGSCWVRKVVSYVSPPWRDAQYQRFYQH